MKTAVFDCMLFVQAMLSRRGPGAACLLLCQEKAVQLLVSPAILAEVREVLDRPAFRNHYTHLTDEKVDAFFQEVRSCAVLVEEVPALFQLPRDPKDEPYLNLALSNNTDFLVTWDKDLLSLNENDAFRQQYPALAIVDLPTFLRQVRAQIARDLGYE